MGDKHKISKRQELRITRDFNEIKQNAMRSPASGALDVFKSDVITDKFRIECKTKEKPSKQIVVKKEWLDKIEQEAFLSNKTPLLAFSFGTSQDYIALRIEDFLEIIGRDLK
jgi:Holliday junction resolvase